MKPYDGRGALKSVVAPARFRVHAWTNGVIASTLQFSLCSGEHRLAGSHFKHSIELVDDNGEIVDQLAGVQDFMLAKATFDAAVRRWPKARIRLCQEAKIVEDSSDSP
jgi:hypothetical protein